MPTVSRFPGLQLGPNVPLLDLAAPDAVNRLLFRLKDSNRALDNLRRALDETARAEQGEVAPLT